MRDLWALTGFEISELFKKKEISAVEICDETIKHIENTNPKINAIVVDTFNEAKNTALSLDKKINKKSDDRVFKILVFIFYTVSTNKPTAFYNK